MSNAQVIYKSSQNSHSSPAVAVLSSHYGLRLDFFLSLVILHVFILVQYPSTDTNTHASPAPDISSSLVTWIDFGASMMAIPADTTLTSQLMLLSLSMSLKCLSISMHKTRLIKKHDFFLLLLLFCYGQLTSLYFTRVPQTVTS